MTDDRGAQRRGGLGQWLPLIVVGVVALYVLLFVIVNRRTVKVDFVVGSSHLSLIWVILLALAAGVLLATVGGRLRRRRRR